MTEDKIILGIDPGTTVMGYGLIHVKKNQLHMLNFGIIQLNKLANHPDKLKRILDRLNGLIAEYKPDEMAIEAPFFGKNVQSMLKLGRAQGVAIAACLNHNIPFEEYTPRRIKQSITGSGAASKEQVAAMLQKLLNFQDMPKYLDATDGLAAAVCFPME
jgi:crossover junction endodeoxyribonuclease RuvC